jgi:hypothetical protein
MTATAVATTTSATVVEVVVVVAIWWRLGGWRSVGLLGRTTGSQKSSLGGALGVSLSRGLLAQNKLACLNERGELREGAAAMS